MPDADWGKGSATFSFDRKYRFSLTREWDARLPQMTWIMLNPSTADETLLDPTIRRCCAFAKREGMGAIEVVNLFALRSTDPKMLHGALDPGDGSRNDTAILEACLHGDIIVAGWGMHGGYLDRGQRVIDLVTHVKGYRLWCLGKTSHGQPRHPLYVSGSQPLQNI